MHFSTGEPLRKPAQNSVVRLTDRLEMTIVANGRKTTNQTET